MKLYVTGSEKRYQELEKKLNGKFQVTYDPRVREGVKEFDIVFDLNLDENFENLEYYYSLKDIPVFGCAVKKQLAGIVAQSGIEVQCKLYGINSLLTFINREQSEFSVFKEHEKNHLKKLMNELGWNYEIVGDRVGMVTPRVIFMIINEACFALQEGTAGKEDIDRSMKLGTNYPKGPFEWADQIGIRDTYETLNAIFTDTGDERYKVCPLLKTKYLKQEKFYS